jgi:hypothetical protein
VQLSVVLDVIALSQYQNGVTKRRSIHDTGTADENKGAGITMTFVTWLKCLCGFHDYEFVGEFDHYTGLHKVVCIYCGDETVYSHGEWMEVKNGR